MKRAVLLLEGALSAFGVGFYWRVLQEGQGVMIYLISQITEEKSANFFSLNTILYVFRYLDPISCRTV